MTKRYSKPATPCDRLLDRDDVGEQTKLRLRTSRAELDAVSLLHSIRESQSALAAVSSPESGAIPDGESLEDFLSQLPDMWRRGEVRPTHARRARGPRTWRTRPDPFEGVWCEILDWLQQQPDTTAADLRNLPRGLRPSRPTEDASVSAGTTGRRCGPHRPLSHLGLRRGHPSSGATGRGSLRFSPGVRL